MHDSASDAIDRLLNETRTRAELDKESGRGGKQLGSRSTGAGQRLGSTSSGAGQRLGSGSSRAGKKLSGSSRIGKQMESNSSSNVDDHQQQTPIQREVHVAFFKDAILFFESRGEETSLSRRRGLHTLKSTAGRHLRYSPVGRE